MTAHFESRIWDPKNERFRAESSCGQRAGRRYNWGHMYQQKVYVAVSLNQYPSCVQLLGLQLALHFETTLDSVLTPLGTPFYHHFGSTLKHFCFPSFIAAEMATMPSSVSFSLATIAGIFLQLPSLTQIISNCLKLWRVWCPPAPPSLLLELSMCH